MRVYGVWFKFALSLSLPAALKRTLAHTLIAIIKYRNLCVCVCVRVCVHVCVCVCVCEREREKLMPIKKYRKLCV